MPEDFIHQISSLRNPLHSALVVVCVFEKAVGN